jgi:hypothetical protein
MIDHGGEAIAKIDAGLAWLPGEPPEPRATGHCFCCGHYFDALHPFLRPSGMCEACRAYLSLETDEDPRDGSTWSERAVATRWGQGA